MPFLQRTISLFYVAKLQALSGQAWVLLSVSSLVLAGKPRPQA